MGHPVDSNDSPSTFPDLEVRREKTDGEESTGDDSENYHRVIDSSIV